MDDEEQLSKMTRLVRISETVLRNGIYCFTNIGELIKFDIFSYRFQHMQQRRCPIYRSEVKYMQNEPVLQFIDMPLDDLSEIPTKEREMQRSDELMTQEQLTPTILLPYPIAQINLVNLNPNIRSSYWVFSGTQSGFGRLHNVISVTR